MSDPYAPPASIARAPEPAAAAPAPQSYTELLSPVDSKFYSVPSGQVDAYLRAGYAKPMGRDVAHERLRKQYSGWQENVTSAGLGFLHGVPLADSAITALSPDGGQAYAEASKLHAEVSPFSTGIGKLGGGIAGVAAAAAAVPEVAAAEIAEAGLAAGAEGTAEYEAAAAAARQGVAKRTAAEYAAKSTGKKVAQFAGETATSGAINAGVGLAAQVDENALNHALDPEGREKLQLSMGGLLADFALGAGFHVGVSGVGKIFKGAGHGIEYMAEHIRGKGITAEAEASAANVSRETSGIPMPEGTPQGQIEGTSAPEAAPATGPLPPDKPISAAAQRIEDLKAAQAAEAARPIDPNESPSVRAQRAKELQAELEQHQSMSEDELIAKYGDPSEIAKAERQDQEIGPLHMQEHAEEAIDRLESISHLPAKEQKVHLKGERTQVMTAFRQAELENELRGETLGSTKARALENDLIKELGANNTLYKEVIKPHLRAAPDEVEQKVLRSKLHPDKTKKTPERLADDIKLADHNRENSGGKDLNLRNLRNLRQALNKKLNFDSPITSPENEAGKRAYARIKQAEADLFRKVRPGEMSHEQYAALNKQYSVNMLADRAVGLPENEGSAGVYARILEESKAAHAAQSERLSKELERATTAKLKEDERVLKAQARVQSMQGKRLKAAEQQKAREDYADAVRKQKASEAQQAKAAREVEAQKAKQVKAEQRVKKEADKKQKQAEAKREREKDRAIEQQKLNEAKYGNAVHAGILGAVTHGMKGGVAGMALSGGLSLLRSIPAERWAQIGDKLAVLFKGVDTKLARTVEAGLYGVPAEIHHALDPNDYPQQAAKIMAVRNGPQNAYTNLAKAHLEDNLPDELAMPMTQAGFTALQTLSSLVPTTAGAPGVYSQDEPDTQQKLTWLGQVRTVNDPTYGIANPTPDNMAILKQCYPSTLYNSQQAALLEVAQNPDLPLEGKMWASQLCERPLTPLATSQFLAVLAGARQQSEQQSAQQNTANSGASPNRKVQSSMSRMDSLQNQDA